MKTNSKTIRLDYFKYFWGDICFYIIKKGLLSWLFERFPLFLKIYAPITYKKIKTLSVKRLNLIKDSTQKYFACFLDNDYVGVILISRQSLFSNLIKWQTRSPFNHSAIVVDNMVYEAVYPTVRVIPLMEFVEENKYCNFWFFTIKTTKQQKNDLVTFLRKQLGKKYDLTMLIRFVTRQQETRKSTNKWFCSELVYAAFKKIGIGLLGLVDPWEVSPRMLSMSSCLDLRLVIIQHNDKIANRNALHLLV